MQPNEAMKAMARRVAAGTKVGVAPQQILDGLWDSSPVVQAALAAIMETQRLDAELVRTLKVPSKLCPLSVAEIAIRTGEHYAFAGERHG